MICPYCKGEGYTHVQWQEGIYHVRTYSVKCYRCDGKGEVEPTNEEFIRNCTTEELAEIIFEVYMTDKHRLFDRIESAEYEHGIGVGGKQEIIKWLGEKHNE